jgi:hypothetical protein
MNNSTFSGLLGLVLRYGRKMLSRKSLANSGKVFSHDLVYKTHDYSGMADYRNVTALERSIKITDQNRTAGPLSSLVPDALPHIVPGRTLV